jgi:hypothetical protein
MRQLIRVVRRLTHCSGDLFVVADFNDRVMMATRGALADGPELFADLGVLGIQRGVLERAVTSELRRTDALRGHG